MLRPVSAKLCRVGDAQSVIGALGADPCFKIEPKNVIYTLTISPPPFLFNPHLLTRYRIEIQLFVIIEKLFDQKYKNESQKWFKIKR